MPANESTTPPLSPWIVAITGGVGSGKSTVASVFVSLGAHHIDADRIAHEVIQTPEVTQQLVQAFGGETLDAAGKPRRDYLSDHIFGCGDGAERERRIAALNRITHPAVRMKIDKMLEMWAQKGFDEASPLPRKRPLLILDIPLLERSPYSTRASTILFIESSFEDRLQRVQDSRGWSEERLREREASQVDLAQKRQGAKQVVTNPNRPDCLQALEISCRELIQEWSREMNS